MTDLRILAPDTEASWTLLDLLADGLIEVVGMDAALQLVWRLTPKGETAGYRMVDDG